jgi:glutaredoxin
MWSSSEVTKYHRKEGDMRFRLLITTAAILLAIPLLCLGETTKASSPGVVNKAKPAVTAELYVTDWCPYCSKAIKFLQANEVPYVVYDIEKDKQAAERKMRLSGRNGVPFAIINGNKVYGFSEYAYMAALASKRP